MTEAWAEYSRLVRLCAEVYDREGETKTYYQLLRERNEAKALFLELCK